MPYKKTAPHQKLFRFFRRYRRLFYLGFALIGLILLIFYFRAFFQSGVTYSGRFLSKSTQNHTVLYSAQDEYGEFVLAVEQTGANEYGVSFTLPYNAFAKTYRVELADEVDFWRQTAIYDQDGVLIFSGKYQWGNSFLYNQNNVPSESSLEKRQADNPYLNYSPNLRQLIGVITGESAVIRGNWLWLLAGAALIGLTVLDWKKSILFRHIPALLDRLAVFPSKATLKLGRSITYGILLLLAFIFLLLAI